LTSATGQLLHSRKEGWDERNFHPIPAYSAIISKEKNPESIVMI